MTDEQKRQKIEDLAAETLEFLDNHDDLSNIHTVDAMAAVMGALLARMRPNVMKSLLPEVQKGIAHYANMMAKEDGAAQV
jgi:hypothetical protein